MFEDRPQFQVLMEFSTSKKKKKKKEKKKEQKGHFSNLGVNMSFMLLED